MRALSVLLISGVCAWTIARADELLVMLDFFPNPNHVPLYVAQEKDYFSAEGLSVRLIAPADASDPAKLCAARAMDLALTPQMNYLIARGASLPLLAVGALIDGALGGVLALRDHGIETLTDLQGGTIGYSLEPLEPVLWRTMLAAAGADPGATKMQYVRMNTRAALLTGTVDAIGAFRNYEAISIELLGKEIVFFPQEDYGVPDTYELVIIAHPALVTERPAAVRGFLAGLSRGIAYTLDNPQQAFSLFAARVPEQDSELGRRSLLETLPYYATGAAHGDRQRWVEMQEYLADHGLVPEEHPPEALYTTDLLP